MAFPEMASPDTSPGRISATEVAPDQICMSQSLGTGAGPVAAERRTSQECEPHCAVAAGRVTTTDAACVPAIVSRSGRVPTLSRSVTRACTVRSRRVALARRDS